MSAIRYVCLSDVHFGAANSLLTDVNADSVTVNPTHASHVLVHLVECLRALVTAMGGDRKPTLVLHGDVLDLALSPLPDSAMAFQRFVELAWPAQGEPLFDSRVIYVPGNHDHFLWRTAISQLYHEDVLATPLDQPLPPIRSVTSMFSALDMDISSPVLAEILGRGSKRRATVTTVYPNFGIVSDRRDRCVVVSHGHYIESIYRLQSRLLDLVFPDQPLAEDIATIERENGDWINYFWSSWGAAGKVGEGVMLVYDKLQDPGHTKALFKTFAESLATLLPGARWEHWLEARVLDAGVDAVCGHMAGMARNQTADVLSADARAGLRWYLEGPVLKELHAELGTRVPDDVTFVFGHTHKPYQAVEAFAGYPVPVKLYNSGGWVVDTPAPNPIEGGALILIDETLGVASLRMYNESADAGRYTVTVEDAATATGGTPGPFCDALRAKVQPAMDPWATFSAAAAREVSLRNDQLRALMNRSV